MNFINPKDIKELKNLSFKKIYYSGDLSLLNRPKISIVGSRRPSSYVKNFTFKIANMLSQRGYVIVSGAAMGVDAIAHRGAGESNTIAVMPGGVDIKYPKVNKNLIEKIEKEALLISPFENGFKPTRWSFVVRNEVVVLLGEVLIITEANLNSGSLRSAEFALKHNKEIFVLPHRANESLGTNYLLKNTLAKPIYDIEEFCNRFKKYADKVDDPFIEYLKSSPLYEDAIKKYKDRIFEAELLGEIEIIDGRVVYKNLATKGA